MINFEDISYLKNGSGRQKHAYDILIRHQILNKLLAYRPILVGTVPIGIDIESSDLDIVCQYSDKKIFFQEMTQYFGKHSGFETFEQTASNALLIHFKLEDFSVEIFAQDIPATRQLGYRHMIIEHRLLIQKGERFRQQIIELKKRGLKTEPAFAQLLGLKGDPYLALLSLE